MKGIDIAVFPQTSEFLQIAKQYTQQHSMNIKYTIKSIKDIDIYKKDILYIVEMPSNDTEKKDTIMEFLNNNDINWICVSNSAETSFKSTSKGAISHIILKDIESEYSIFIKLLCVKIKEAINDIYEENIQCGTIDNTKKCDKIISIGASTGGTEAIIEILTRLEKNTPPIIVVIHMPSGFTKMYAKKLNEICKMYVKEAKNNDIVKDGVVYIAKGGRQLRVVKKYNNLYIQYNEETKVNGHCPSVDVLFDSINKLSIKKIAIILTGMGDDGAKKITEIRENGGLTIGQDKKTSIVYGMPKIAYDLGGICIQSPIFDIAKVIKQNI